MALLGGAAAAIWPLAARAQQAGRPIIGFLGSSSSGADNIARIIEDLRRGLGDVGFVEGHNLVIEYRWAQGRYDRLPTLAAELVRHPVSVIVAGGITAAVAAKAATGTIPIVFYTDPVKLGLVGSLNKPDGNVTGAVYWGKQLVAKQFELMHDLMPKAHAIAFLVNPRNAATEDETNEMGMAASAIGQKLVVVRAVSEDDLAGAFAT
jgi:putative ABC transport system substrate-binding protein